MYELKVKNGTYKANEDDMASTSMMTWEEAYDV